MQKHFTRFVVFIFLSFSFYSGWAQNAAAPSEPAIKNIEKKSNDDLLKLARKYLDQLDFAPARLCYLELIKRDSTNLKYNFEIGLTYYESPNEQLRSLPFFETVARHLNRDTLVEVYYYMGKTLHLANRFDEAIDAFEKYLSLFKLQTKKFNEEDEEGRSLITEAERSIEMCKNAKTLTQIPVTKIEMNGRLKDYEIVNLKENINSKFDDYGPVLSPDDSTIYFTSRRKRKGNTADPEEEGKFYEDIYTSKLGQNGWEPSKLVGKPVNSSENDAADFVDKDGKTLYFTKGDNKGTFYSSTREGNSWSAPVPFDKTGKINTDYWETSLFPSANGQVIYFASERPRGFGGRDLYKSSKQSDGSWGTPENLGSTINSEYDEDAPYVTPDGKTLYFASKGHNSMGGFDIFKSVYENGKWSEPRNLGYPINTPGNDIYFIFNHDVDQAFYSSARADAEVDGNDMDVFSIDICDDIPLTTIKGVLVSKDGPVNDVFLTVIDKETRKKIARYAVGKDGKYTLNLLRNRTNIITFEGKGIVYFSQEISLPKQCKAYDLFQKIEITRKMDLAAQQWMQHVIFKNAFFDIKKRTRILKFEKSKDEFENYSAFVDNLSQNGTRLNYVEISSKNCISDIFDVGKLKLNFLNPEGKNVESAFYNKGFFNFQKVQPGQDGTFKLDGQDPELEYTINVVTGKDTLRAEQNKDHFIFPKAKLASSDAGGNVIETVPLNYRGAFVFHKLSDNSKNTYKLLNADNNSIYEINYLSADGSLASASEIQNNEVFPLKRMRSFNQNGELIESALINKSNTFVFNKLKPGEQPLFKIDGAEDPGMVYDVKVMQGGGGALNLLYNDGKAFTKRTLHFFKPNGAYSESAYINKEGVFGFKKTASDEPGFFKLEGDNIDETFITRMNISRKPFEAVRAKDGFIRTDNMSAQEVNDILKLDTLVILGDKKNSSAKLDSAFASLISRNYSKYQEQLALRKNEVPALDTTRAFPPRKLVAYNAFGDAIESAALTKGNAFNFTALPTDKFILYRIEGEEPDPDAVYQINLTDQGKIKKSIKMNELSHQDGYAFEQKRMSFYDSKGQLVETATINKNGQFVFTKLPADEKGLFKIEGEDTQLAVYALKIEKASSIKELCYQGGITFPKQTMRFYDNEGQLVETALINKEGSFNFTQLPVDQAGLFLIDADDANSINLAKINIKGKEVETVRSRAGFLRTDQLDAFKPDFLAANDSVQYLSFVKELATVDKANTAKRTQLIKEAISLVNKNEQLKRTTLYAYDTDGKLLDVASMNKAHQFVFTKLPAEEFSLFKFANDDVNPTLDYKVKVMKADGAAAKITALNEMKKEDGFIFQNKKLNFYNEGGQLVETASISRKGDFVFTKIRPDEKGLYKLDDQKDPGLYEIKISKPGAATKVLEYQEGVAFEKRTLHFYDSKGNLVEDAKMNKNGVFVFNKLPLDENGSFEMDAENDPGIASVKLQAGGIPFDAVRSRNGFVRLENMNAAQLTSLDASDSSSFAGIKTKLVALDSRDSVKKAQLTKELVALVEKNTINRKTRLGFYDADGKLVETVSLAKGNDFVFTKLKPDEFGTFKLEEGNLDPRLNYSVKVTRDNKTERVIKTDDLVMQEGVLLPKNKLSFYDEKGNLVETASVNKKGEFVFQKLKADEVGSFRSDNNIADPTLYTIKIAKGTSTKRLEFQDGTAFAYRTLTAFDGEGKAIETARQNKNGLFVFSKLSSAEAASMKLESDDAKDVPIVKLNFGGQRTEAVKTKEGFVRVDKLAGIPLASLSSKDSQRYADIKQELSSVKEEDKKQELLNELVVLVNKNETVKATASVAEVNEAIAKSDITKKSIDKTSTSGIAIASSVTPEIKSTTIASVVEQPAPKPVTLYAYDVNGNIVDFAKANKAGEFVFEKLPVNEFSIFKFEDGNVDPKLDYKVKIVSPGGTIAKATSIKEMKKDGGYFFQEKKLSFYNSAGQLVETAGVNHKGDFVFSKISPTEKGSFKLADPADKTFYEIKIAKAGGQPKTLRYKDGMAYENKLLHFYDASGKFVETGVMNRNGVFAFNQTLDPNGSFKLEGDDQSKTSSVKLQSADGSQFYAVRSAEEFVKAENVSSTQLTALDVTDSTQFAAIKKQLAVVDKKDTAAKASLEKQLVALVERNQANSKTRLSFYNSNGQLQETVQLTKGNSFEFTKLEPDEFGFFKVEDGTLDPKLTYNVKFVHDAKVERVIKTDELAMKEGVLLPKKKLSFYDQKGNIVETATVNTKGEFVFQKLKQSDQGSFKFDDNTHDPTLYAIRLAKGNSTVKRLQYQDGTTYAYRTVTVYDNAGKPIETARQNKNGEFTFKKSSAADVANIKLEGDDTKDVSLVKLNLAGKPVDVFKTKKGFETVDKLAGSSVSALNENDAQHFAEIKQQLASNNDPVKKQELLTQLVALATKNDSLGKTVVASNSKKPPVIAEPGSVPEFTNILFDFSKADVRDEYNAELDEVASYLKTNNKHLVLVAGHTDSKGNLDYNLRLSERRVNSVVKYLASKGVARKCISTKLFGKSQPIAPNENPDGSDNPDGRAKNRRVELKVIQ